MCGWKWLELNINSEHTNYGLILPTGLKRQMTFFKSGRFYIVTRHDSFLAIEFAKEGVIREPVVRTLPPINDFGYRLNSAQVLIEVTKGVNQANHKFQKNYVVKEIHYVEDDAPPESLYSDMVRELIQILESDDSLKEINYKYGDD